MAFLAGAVFCTGLSVRGQIMSEMETPQKLHVILFNQDVAAVKRNIVEKLSGLSGVKVDPATGQVAYREKKIRYGSSGVRKPPYIGADRVEEVSFVVTWIPPEIGPQRISAGGPRVSPRPSAIVIDVFTLKTNPCAVAVDVFREWIYHGSTHVPYTEIPLLPGNTSHTGGIKADETWVRSLGEVAGEVSHAEFSGKLVEALERLPDGGREPVKAGASLR